jgi:hypothetical protein
MLDIHESVFKTDTYKVGRKSIPLKTIWQNFLRSGPYGTTILTTMITL